MRIIIDAYLSYLDEIVCKNILEFSPAKYTRAHLLNRPPQDSSGSVSVQERVKSRDGHGEL